MWLKNLKELKEKTKMSCRDIAIKTNLPEKTISRIFSGITENPTITTLIPIITALGGSFDEIFADTQALVTNNTLTELQADIDELKTKNELLIADNTLLKTEINTLTARLELTEMKLMYSEKLLAVYDHYNK